LLLLSAIDCERLLLPDMLTLPGAVLAVLMCSGQGLPLVDSLLGASVGGVGFWFLARSFPRCLGLGDAKLMLLLGALCGVRGVPMIVAIGSACGLAFALSTGRKRVPFGPCLNLGAYCHMLGVQA
ncbi:MAG: A24 family peptidase, partial [Bilophila sp.]